MCNICMCGCFTGYVLKLLIYMIVHVHMLTRNRLGINGVRNREWEETMRVGRKDRKMVGGRDRAMEGGREREKGGEGEIR